MWSVGMVLYYLCYSGVPFSQTDDVDLLKAEIMSIDGYSFLNFSETMKFPDAGDRVPLELKQMIRCLLSKTPSKRPHSEKLLDDIEMIRSSLLNSPGLVPEISRVSKRNHFSSMLVVATMHAPSITIFASLFVVTGICYPYSSSIVAIVTLLSSSIIKFLIPGMNNYHLSLLLTICLVVLYVTNQQCAK